MVGALIGTGVNVVANAIGSFIANKKKKDAEERYQSQIQGEMEKLDNEISTNFLDRADARNAIRKVTDANNETLRQLNTEAIRGGATDEAKVAMASQLNKRTADVVGDLAAVGEQRKDALKDKKRELTLGLMEHQYQLGSDTSGMDTLLSNIGSAASSLGTAWGAKDDDEKIKNGKE